MNNGFIVGQNPANQASILRTTDGGVSWIAQAFDNTSEFQALQMLTPTAGYAAGFNFGDATGIVYKTVDGGISWTGQTISILPDNLVIRDLSFTDSLTGFICGEFVDVATSTNSGVVFKTTDGGSTWSRTNIPSAAFLRDIQMVTDSIGYLAGTLVGSTGGGTSQILKTANAGNTWTIENTGPPIYGIGSMHFPDKDHGYAMEDITGIGMIGNILKFDSNVNCFAYYSVSYDSITNIFTVLVDSTSAAQAVSYLWDFGDSTTSTFATPTHVVPNDTAYNVCMKIYLATGDSCQYCHLLGKDNFSNIIRNVGYTINISTGSPTVGISLATSKPDDILVYPNPANGIFNIRTKGQPDDATVKVLDITGRLVLKKTITETDFQIDLSAESSGIYILELSNKNGVSRIKLGKK